MSYEPIVPVPVPADFVGYEDIFSAIRAHDCMVHHPYESFDVVVNFVRAAAEDPDVLAIKQTLYRVSGNSPIVAALEKAAENGKQVTVLVELKARFDEENNIHWAQKLEKAGCHVVYGLSGLKTHCKILLVVRREEDGIRPLCPYGHRQLQRFDRSIYTDIGVMTCKEPYGSDASSLFNVLTGYSRPPRYTGLSPPDRHAPLLPGDDRRGDYRRLPGPALRHHGEGQLAGRPRHHRAPLQGLPGGRPDQADRPGHLLPDSRRSGLSENITVHSIVGQLLEHSRIFKFECGGKPRIWMGSADWMQRNLDHRVELVFPD